DNGHAKGGMAMPPATKGIGAMQRVAPVALPCRVSRGAFSDELVFEIASAGSTAPHIGAASRQYFWKENRKPFGPDEPSEGIQARSLIVAAMRRFFVPTASCCGRPKSALAPRSRVPA